jgi:hypothetical protein
MVTDPPLNDVERKALRTLMQEGRSRAACTPEAIAGAIGEEVDATHGALRSLEDRRPQLAHPNADAGLGKQVWFSTYDAAEIIEG